METNTQTPMWKHAFTQGTIWGIVLVIFSLLMYFLDLSLKQWVGWLAYGILIAGIYLSAKTYRDQELGGAIEYSKVLGYGTLLGLMAGILSGIFTYVLYSMIDPGLMDKLFVMMEDQMLAQGLTDEQVEQALTMQKGFMTPGFMAAVSIPTFALYGFIFSLIVGLFVKKQADPFDKAMQNVEE